MAPDPIPAHCHAVKRRHVGLVVWAGAVLACLGGCGTSTTTAPAASPAVSTRIPAATPAPSPTPLSMRQAGLDYIVVADGFDVRYLHDLSAYDAAITLAQQHASERACVSDLAILLSGLRSLPFPSTVQHDADTLIADVTRVANDYQALANLPTAPTAATTEAGAADNKATVAAIATVRHDLGLPPAPTVAP